MKTTHTEAGRWFLNTLLDDQAPRGLGHRVPFPETSWNDVAIVLTTMTARPTGCKPGIDRAAAQPLRDIVIPLASPHLQPGTRRRFLLPGLHHRHRPDRGYPAVGEP